MPDFGFASVQFTSNSVNHAKVHEFSYSTSASKLGAEATVRVADLNQALHVHGTFELSITWGPSPSSLDTMILIGSGRLVSRTTTIQVQPSIPPIPDDQASVKALDRIGDRWSLAPRIPVLIYDPNKYNPVTQGSEIHADVRDINNNPIFAQYAAQPGLDLAYLLNLAYVQGCGFPGVVTNIPTYPIRYAAFNIQNSFHDSVRSFTNFWEPIYFVDENENLEIIDINAPYSADAPLGHIVAASKFRMSRAEVPFTQFVNALLLSYQEDVNEASLDIPGSATPSVVPDAQEIGTPGSPGYHRTYREVTQIQFHDDPSDTARVTRTVDTGFTESTWATVNGTTQLIKQETQTDSFVPGQNFRISNGYHKTMGALAALPEGTPNPDGSVSTTFVPDVTVEDVSIDWKPSVYTPDVWIQLTKRKSVSGMILIDGDAADPATLKLPLLDAYNQKLIKQDGSQSSTSAPLKTEVTHVRELGNGSGSGQVEVHIDSVNQLTNAVDRSDTYQGVGSAMVTVGRWRTLTTLITNSASENDPTIGPRKPEQMNAGEIPFQLALPVAQRKLNRWANPPYTVEVELASLDLNINKGVVRRIQDRNGNMLKDEGGNDISWVVTEYTVKGSSLGAGDGSARISMSFKAIQLLRS